MRVFIIFLCAILFSLQSLAQIIKGFPSTETEIDHRKIYARTRPDIFKDFAFLEPETKVNKIAFTDHIYYFMMFGTSFQITQIDTNMMELKGNGSSVMASKEISAHNIYYDKSLLKRNAIEKLRWVPYQTIESKVIPVKHLTPGSTKDYYTSFEAHSISQTKWKWEKAVDSALVIPSCYCYELPLNDDRVLYVYETKNASGKTEYYLQNASYLSAINPDGVECILLDEDCNGSYTDPNDKILLNSWNPYSMQSTYKKVKFVKENSWYTVADFYNEYLTKINYQNGKVSFDAVNDTYEGNKKTGAVQFRKLPKNCSLWVNANEYTAHKGKNKFECEFGVYKAIVRCKGALDFEAYFTLNDNNTKQEIRYVKTAPAGVLKINNIFADDFFATVKNANGYSRTYRNLTEICVPPGNNQLILYTDGFSSVYSFSVNENEIHELDFEAELKKTIK